MKLFEAAKSVNIVDVYDKLSAAPAKRNPKGGSGHCPFHDDVHPSLALYTDNNSFTCHCGSCGAHGSAIDLTMRMLGLDNRSAAEWICRTFGVAYDNGVPYDKYIPARAAGEKKEPADDVFLVNYETMANYFHAYLKKAPNPKFFEERGIGALTEEFRFGYCPGGIVFTKKVDVAKSLNLSNDKGECVFAGRYIVPLTNYKGQVIGFIGRLPDEKVDEDHPKYLISENSPIFKKRSFFFNPKALVEKEYDRVLVVEGVFDVLAYIMAGVRNVVSPLGCSLSDAHLNILRSRKDREVVIAFDRDEAGNKATMKAVEYAKDLRIALLIADFKEQKDANAILLSEGPEFLATTVFQSMLAPDYLLMAYEKTGLINSQKGRADLNIKLAKSIGYTTLPLAEQYPMNKAYAPIEIEDYWERFNKIAH